MNREIKFRVWDKTQNKMKEVWLNKLIDRFGVSGPSVFDNEDFDVMQFTGLQDELGVDIFEGDIVNCNRYENMENLQVQIEDIRNLPPELFGSNLNYHEIIGNIYQNPDLLKSVAIIKCQNK